MRLIQRFFAALGVTTFACMAFAGAFAVVPVRASTLFEDVCGSGTKDSAVCTEQAKGQTAKSNSIYGPNGVLGKATNVVTFVVAVASVIIITVAGVKYVLSSGDSSKITQARDTIIYALVGLIVAILARQIIFFVISKIN